MRITQIRTWKNFGRYCIDQAAHAAIVLAVTAWWANTPGEVAISGAILLTIREGEQGRETVEEWRRARVDERFWNAKKPAGVAVHRVPDWLDLLCDLHLPDRLGDIAWGASIASGAFSILA